MVTLSSPSAGSVPAAFVLGLDMPAGAYLARLLQARGQRVSGTAAAGPSLLAALGSQDDVAEVAPENAAAAAARAVSVYIVSSDRDGTAALVDDVLGAAPTEARLVHVVDKGLLVAHRPAMQLAREISRIRRETGRFAVNAILHAHDSRLGRPDVLPARLSLAAFRAANGRAAVPLALADSAAEDWGWTPEYVDAVARLAASPMATDIEVASGEAMTAHQMADHAGRWFRLDPEAWLARLPAEGPAEPPPPPPVDVARLKALLGWRAYTTGGDLIAALCEAAAEREPRKMHGQDGP
ncbi:hypothetical protein [Polymorphobacter sp.]|uniref:hypothetical protein n=1 Tax=Polymorphobacter sp. TaxID=1909290 RepID=UPI003F6E633A